MKTQRRVFLRPQGQARIRNRATVDDVQRGELAIVDGKPYLRTPAGDLIELAVVGE